MTNEEIEKEARATVAKYFSGPVPIYNNCVDAVAELCRSLVSRAYEEAAQLVERDVGLTNLSDDIRALKDSLCPHEWTDVRNDVVTSGEMCLKCGAVRAGNASSVNESVSSS